MRALSRAQHASRAQPKRLKLCVRCEGEFDQAYPITDECRVEHTWGGTAGSGNNSLSFVKYCTSCERNISCGHYGVITHKEDRWCYIGAHKASGRRVIGCTTARSCARVLTWAVQGAAERAFDSHYTWCDG